MKKPSLIIGGVQKGGTKALIDYLAQHPNIYAYPHEIDFFNRKYKKGKEWYFSLFNDAREDQIAIEKSPGYITHPQAAERIKKTIPRVKLIFILRDPVKRAYSHYWMNVLKGLERRSFAEAIRAEPRPEPETHNYVSRGFYYEQLKRYYERFNKEQILILQSTDLRNKTQETINKVTDFVDINHYKIQKIHGKVGAQPKSKTYSFFLSYAIQFPLLKQTQFDAVGKIRKKLITINEGEPYPPIREEDKKFLENIYAKH